MANAAQTRCRLCLVTPPAYDAKLLPARLADALAGGDVASLIVTPPADPGDFEDTAAALARIAVERNVAALVLNDTRIAATVQADGVHFERGTRPLDDAVAAQRKNRRIVGIGNLRTRHEALEAGELAPDYLFFGRLDGDFDAGIFPRSLELAEWWSAVTVIPAIVMGGRAIASVAEAAAAGIAFVALSAAVWQHPAGPARAVAEAAVLLASAEETVA
jgi:thiamine-phosphate pyrophosphorylase